MDAHKSHEKGKVYFGAMRSGYEMKMALRDFVEECGYLAIDLGVFGIEDQATVEDMGREVAEKVVENEHQDETAYDTKNHGNGIYGVLISAVGDDLVAEANKLCDACAVVVTSEHAAQRARDSEHTKIIGIGADITDLEEVKKIIGVFTGCQS